MRTNRLIALLLGGLMACSFLTVNGQEKEQIIEHEGNKYTIHVERLNPDSEMTLLDVLHICPELMSSDGKTLTADYLLSVDEIPLNIDYESLLNEINACDLSDVTVFVYGNVNSAMDGVTGYIDLRFKEGKGLTGKLAVNGSTYGNGQLYANIANSGDKVTVRALAQTNLRYGKAESLSGSSVTSRNNVENAMVFIDWQATENDLLKLKLSQGYEEYKSHVYDVDGDSESDIIRQRWGELVATYERTLNEQGAGLYFETGMNYDNMSIYQFDEQTVVPWWIAECSIPLVPQSLSLTAGYEGGYTNLWLHEFRREQNLYHDLYVLLDFNKGPWTISLGDRFRHNTFWDKHYDEDPSNLWSHNRNDHALHASVGYRRGRHFVQAIFNRSFFNPLASDFHTYSEDGSYLHSTDYKTNLAWRSEARYTYQADRFLAMGSVAYTLLSDMPTPNESLISLASSVTWHQKNFRLTAGANVHHLHISYDDAVNATYYTLKLAPTLLLGKGLRLSSVLIYNDATNQHAHLYASVKMGKDIGKRCHLFADFHDLAGQPKADLYLLSHSYKNRALTIGLTYYPWR